MKIIEYRLPAWSLPYLINSDPSGLSDEEIIKVDTFVSRQLCQKGFDTFIVTSPDKDSYFYWHNDIDNLGDDVYDCLVIVGL